MSKILVVEDSKSVREEICEILHFEDFEVIFAENGAQGLEKANNELPDLIISDVTMPKLSGYKLLTELKKSPKTESIPFIFLSGKTKLPDLRKGMNIGADGYFLKPINTDELIKVVKSKLKKQQVIKANIVKLEEENKYSLKEAGRMAKMGYWSYDNKTKVLVWSGAVYEIYGTDSKDGVPETDIILSFFNQKSQQKINKVKLDLISHGTPYDIELQLTNFKNQERWIRSIGEAVYNDKKEMIGRKGVYQDITEQKKIEEKNLRITEDYKELFDNVAISIWNEDLSLVFEQIDKLRKLNIPNIKIYLEQHPKALSSLVAKVRISSVNKATLKLFDAKSTQEFLNNVQNVQNVFGKGAGAVFINFIRAIWNNDEVFTSEINYKKLNGDEFAAVLSISIPQTVVKQKTVPVSIQSIQSIKNAESEKKESLNKLNEAQKLAHIGNWSFNTSSQEIKWSDETFHIWGFDPENGAPNFNSMLNRIHIDDQELFNSVVSEAISLGTSYDIEHRIHLPNDAQKTIRAIGKPLIGSSGEVIGLLGTTQDITEQKEASQKIEEAEEMYRILTDHSNDLICLQEPDSTFKYISPSIKNLLGYEQSDFIGKKVFSIVHKDDVQSLKVALEEKVFKGIVLDPLPFRVRHKKGHFIWLEFLVSPIYKDNKMSYYVSSSRDITHWMLAKQEIQKYQTTLQKLTIEITLVEEKQKKEIASNIHDHLSQSLIISKMKIDKLKKNKALKVISEDLKFIETHISEALENSRKITYELSPPVLYKLGIIAALNWLLEELEAKYKIKCMLNSNVNHIQLNDEKSILLYRSVQEIIMNAIKYANASLITLDINKNDLGLHILVKDNGDGFDTAALNNQNHSGSGFGLFTVKERIRNIQGTFTITSEIKTGTTVNFFTPLSI